MTAGAGRVDPAVHWRSIVDVLRWRSQHEPKRSACSFLINGDDLEERATYADLDRRARALAAGLQARGAAGARVLLLHPPGLDYVGALLACMYAGAVPVPAYPPPLREVRPAMLRLAAILEDAGAKFLLASREIVERARPLCAREGPFAELCWLPVEELDGGSADDWREVRPGAGDVAFVQYTSGATGEPKGVMLTHANLLSNLAVIRTCFEVDRHSRTVIWLPPYHDMGLIGGILEPLFAGFPVVLLPALRFIQRPILWLRAISRQRAAVSGGPNFAYDLCVTRTTPEQRAGLDLSSWRVAFNGAETVRNETLERFAATYREYGFRPEAFRPCYGLAEATLLVAGARRPVSRVFDAPALEQGRVVPLAAGAPGRTLTTCGGTWGDDEVAIVDRRRLVRCAHDEIGEIWVRGPSVAQGYWNRGRASGAFGAHLADTGAGPFLRTGDLGFWFEGDLFVTGRGKDLIVIRGRNHQPQDIERTVEACHGGLLGGEGAAFTVERDGQETLIVVQAVERAWTARLPLREVREDIVEAVAREHGLHADVLLVKPGVVPRTSSGKIMRSACSRLFLTGSLQALEAERGAD